MISSILTIIASVAGLVASWALWKFILRPLVQQYINWKTTQDNKKALEDASNENQKQNEQDQKDQQHRGDIWHRIDPKP